MWGTGSVPTCKQGEDAGDFIEEIDDGDLKNQGKIGRAEEANMKAEAGSFLTGSVERRCKGGQLIGYSR